MVKKFFTLNLPQTRGFLTSRTGAFISDLSILVKKSGAGSLTYPEIIPCRPRQRYRLGGEMVYMPEAEGDELRAVATRKAPD